MKFKTTFCGKIVSLILALVIALIVPASSIKVSALVADLQPKVLEQYERQILDMEEPLQQVLGNFKGDGHTLLNDKTKSLLDTFGVVESRVLDEKRVDFQIVKDNILQKVVYSLSLDETKIDVDVQGNVLRIVNAADLSVEDKGRTDYKEGEIKETKSYAIDTEAEVMPFVRSIEKELNLSGYELCELDNEAYPSVWTLSWCRRLENGVLNPLDNVTITLDANDGSVFTYNTNHMIPAETEAILDEEDAIVVAKTIESARTAKVGVAELTVVRPNFYWEGQNYESADFARLAWRVTLDKSILVDIDACTGEILGGGVLMSSKHDRCMCTLPESVDAAHCVGIAHNAFLRLGYTLDGANGNVCANVQLRDVEWMLNEEDLSALYLRCHGSPTTISDNRSWAFHYTDLESDRGFHFVYLDACQSASANWVVAFNIQRNATQTYSGKCFVGWNVSVLQVTSSQFNRVFFNQLNLYSVLDCLLLARNNVRSVYGATDCNPGFWGDTSYWGTAW